MAIGMSGSGAGVILTVGAPVVTGGGREVFAFHLYRYLSPWLREAGCERVLVRLGFPGSAADLGSYQISASRGVPVQAHWTVEDLEAAWRFGSGALMWETAEGGAVDFRLVPISCPEAREEAGAEEFLGFLLVRGDERLEEEDLERLSLHAAEAVQVARRNGVRLFFDEYSEAPIKEWLYSLMDRLPEWLGCDHSASVILTNDLDAMTLQGSDGGAFNVLAERLFVAAEPGTSPDRLVGMEGEMSAGQILEDAMERAREEPEVPFWVYHHRGGEREEWCRAGTEEGLSRWHCLRDRSPEATVVLAPLSHHSLGERDLLGFLTVCFRQPTALSRARQKVLAEVADGIAGRLKPSALYTMSVRKMWVLKAIADRVERRIAGGERGEGAVEAMVAEVSDLVASHVDVPSFAIGVLVGGGGDRRLRYDHPHGWSRFERIELAVDVDVDDRVDSGISALSIRLGRPVVLAGGHGAGVDQEFKNFLWVHEEEGAIYDARGRSCPEEPREAGCTRLREYYKPAREEAYASLAYPITFGKEALGVLTVEVEKTTDWIWWTGFGGHLFWEMVAREVGLGLYGLRGEDGDGPQES